MNVIVITALVHFTPQIQNDIALDQFENGNHAVRTTEYWHNYAQLGLVIGNLVIFIWILASAWSYKPKEESETPVKEIENG